MAMNRFVDFVPKQDNVGMTISAQDVNELQGQVEIQERTLFGMEDSDFLDKALFTLENHPMVNTMMVLLFDNPYMVDMVLSTNITYSADERDVLLLPNQVQGYYVSPTHINRNESVVSNVLLLTLDYQPAGTHITYEVSNNTTDYQPILPNISAPLTLVSEGSRLKLRAKMTRDSESVTETPAIKAVALLYKDPKVGIIELPGGQVIVPGASLGV